MTPDEYCAQRASRSHSSFTTSFLFLPAERRRAITALYAFCREVDAAVDDCPDAETARGKLDGWRNEIAALDASAPIHALHPVTQALAAAREHFSLPTEQLTEIIDGMEMDLDHARYPDFKALHLYCYRVASVVGLLAAEIFGVTDRRTLKYAHDLGLAFQLTNIIRDVGEDARRGRIYLPQDELARFGVSEADLLECRPSGNFSRLMEFQAARAVEHYGRALAQLPAADRKAQRAGLIMAAIYRETLDEIIRGGFDVLDRRTRLSKPRKLWIAVKTWLAA